MGTPERIEAVAEHVIETLRAGHKVVVVVSAMAGETNRLLGLAQQIDTRPATRELDMLAASGEQVSVALLAIALIKRGYPAVSLLADQVGILTDNKFGRARIVSVARNRLDAALEQGHVAIVAGFQGRDIEGNITTLGRGGSDTTAVALAAALQADECQIFTDVDGIYSIDPRICASAYRLPLVDGDSMLELASLGAKVLHSRSIEYAATHQVPLRVLSSFKPDGGSLVCYQGAAMSLPLLTGIACQKDEVWFQLQGIPASLQTKLFKEFARYSIETDLFTLQEPEQVGFSLNRSDLAVVEDLCKELSKDHAFKWIAYTGLAKLSIVGVGVKANPMVMAVVLEQLQLNAVEPVALQCSEIKLSVMFLERHLTILAHELHQCLLVRES